MRNKIIIFENKKIRRVWHEDDWWFSVVDVVGVLTESDFQRARKYWNKLIQRLRDEGNELVTICHRLKLLSSDGKMRETDCANKDFAILTNEISKAIFGAGIKEHKKIKGIQNKKKNLRNYMTDWELILNMIGEKVTIDITIVEDNQDFKECKNSAKEGWKIAGNTRKEIEQKTGKTIVSRENFIGKQNKKVEGKNEEYLQN